MNGNFEEIKEMLSFDDRIGTSHTKVPGPDGDFGYGGHCFPKDLASYISFSKKNNFESFIGLAAQKVNDKVRTNKDWLKQIGRAVIDK